ncbi:MAG: lysophospholipid acyltransferase family protein [Bacteroidales bacterium]|jgi:putative hemolysin
MKTKVINNSDIKRVIKMRGPLGSFIASILMWLLGFNKANKIYDKYKSYNGADFCEEILKGLNIKYDIIPHQLDYVPQEGAFITISNHSYGGVDGIISLTIFGSMRCDYKTLSNFILTMIPNLKDTFLPVNPFSNMPGIKSSFSGIRMAKEHLNSGGALGLFPAGEVSTFQRPGKKVAPKKGRVCEDIAWPENMIKLIKTAGVPVIPVYFDGENSKIFHFLGKINPMLRTVSLLREVYNKKGKSIKMRIGKPIGVSEIAEYSNLKELGEYLRNRVYSLEGDLSNVNTALNVSPEKIVPIALPKDKKTIIKEFEKIKSKKLFESSSFQCFLTDYQEIPNIIHEIGRKREEAFRATGEGVNLPLDLDEYDTYFKHLILWDKNKKKIAGAYRLGIGKEIFESHGGISGFYTQNLFKYGQGFGEILKQSIELGRSFVSVDYQKETLPLSLLFKGLMYSLLLYPDTAYFIGPVSISNWYPRFYQSLMVYYLSNNHSIDHKKKEISPRNPFSPDFLRVDPGALLLKKMDSFDKFDRFLLRISDNKYRVPTLVKKYIKINSKIICYNVDPLFNYSLDGLILLKIKNFPKREILNMSKDMDKLEQEKILKRFGYSLNEEN